MMPTGWNPGSRTIDEMGKLYPKTSAARVFFREGEGLPPTAWTDPTRVGRQRLVDLPQGCTVIVSFKDQLVDRAAFVAAWQAARPDVRLVLITHHEPEQQEGGDPTRAEYRASWTRTREQVGNHPARAAGRLILATCWTLQWIRRGGDWRIWWPDHEAAAVDLVLFDWYPYTPGAPNPYKPTAYEDPAAALKVPIDIARQLGKAWGLGEIDHPRILKVNGFAIDLDPDGALCAPWYRNMHATAKAAGAKVWAHFHANMGAAVGDLTTRPAEQAVFRELIVQEATVTQPEPTPELTREDVKAAVIDALRESLPLGAAGPAKRLADKGWSTNLSVLALLAYMFEHSVGGEVAALRALVTEGFAQDDTDEEAIIAGVEAALAPVLAKLTPEQIAAAIPDALAEDVVDALHARTAPRPPAATA